MPYAINLHSVTYIKMSSFVWVPDNDRKAETLWGNSRVGVQVCSEVIFTNIKRHSYIFQGSEEPITEA